MNWAWFHRFGSPKWFFEFAGRWMPAIAALACVLMLAGIVWGLAFAPRDYLQGNSFRIIYIHVPSAALAMSCYMAMAAAGVVLLVWRMKLADVFIRVAAPIGAAFTFLALFTGAVWGKPTWGTWWVWDARLTSMLILLFLYFGIMALRSAISDETNGSRACAVLAMVGAVNIPIIKYSVNWWNTLHQPATFKLTSAPSMAPEMYWPLLLTFLGTYLAFGALVMWRMRDEILWRERRTRWVRDYVGGGHSDAV